MTTQTTTTTLEDKRALLGQTLVVLGGSSGIGLETARLARSEGAEVIITGRNSDRLAQAADDVGAMHTAAFDADDAGELERFFDELPAPIDHVLITAGRPYYAPLTDFDFDLARRELDDVLIAIRVGQLTERTARPGGTLTLMSGTGARRPAVGLSIIATLTAGMPALTKNLALELAPLRVNLIAPGFVDTPLSATILGDQLDARREQLRTTLPIRRVVGPQDVAALAVHLMINTALTGSTYDVDGGQQFVSA